MKKDAKRHCIIPDSANVTNGLCVMIEGVAEVAQSASSWEIYAMVERVLRQTRGLIGADVLSCPF